ncbi:hypothetical protein, partial [Luteococcus japonicus]|uniref:hypothetical protein n=1 Tax=Luteococcus japonicus TaxID=33984 RepID=UPI001C4E2855
ITFGMTASSRTQKDAASNLGRFTITRILSTNSLSGHPGAVQKAGFPPARGSRDGTWWHE